MTRATATRVRTGTSGWGNENRCHSHSKAEGPSSGSARAVPGALDVGGLGVLLVRVMGEEGREQLEQVGDRQRVPVAGLARAGRLDVAVDVEGRPPPGRVGGEQVGGYEPLPDGGDDLPVGLVDRVEIGLFVDELLDDAE